MVEDCLENGTETTAGRVYQSARGESEPDRLGQVANVFGVNPRPKAAERTQPPRSRRYEL